MKLRCATTTIAALIALAASGGCGAPPNDAPDLSGLTLGMDYPALAARVGGECQALHDRGVRQLEWHFEDGSLVEATILDGKLSGLEYEDGQAPRGRSIAAVRIKLAVQSDSSEVWLRELLGDHAITTDDISDRECRWDFESGQLTATFMRGRLEQADWHPASGDEAMQLVTVNDPVVLLVDALRSHRRSDRYRALSSLQSVDDPRIADALLELLPRETDRQNRGMVADLLGRAGEPRASGPLLALLDDRPLQTEIIDALASVGDAHAEITLGGLQENIDDPKLKRAIARARSAIDRRIGRDWPVRRKR